MPTQAAKNIIQLMPNTRMSTPDSHSVPDMIFTPSSTRSFVRSAAQSHRLNVSVAAAEKVQVALITRKIDVAIQTVD